MDAVLQRGGRPERVRMDHGTENVNVELLQELLNEDDDDNLSNQHCVITGSSLTSALRGIRKNRTLCDRNLKFGTMIEYDLTKILRYGAIADLSPKQNGRRFLLLQYPNT